MGVSRAALEPGPHAAAMGIQHASSIEPAQGSAGLQLWTGGGFVVSSEQVTGAIEHEAAKDDNARKLDRPATRRHLFVFLSTATGGPELHALHQVIEGHELFPMPPKPKLPREVTTAWAAAGWSGVYITPPGEWSTFATPDDLVAEPSSVLLPDDGKG